MCGGVQSWMRVKISGIVPFPSVIRSMETIMGMKRGGRGMDKLGGGGQKGGRELGNQWAHCQRGVTSPACPPTVDLHPPAPPHSDCSGYLFMCSVPYPAATSGFSRRRRRRRGRFPEAGLGSETSPESSLLFIYVDQNHLATKEATASFYVSI